MTVVNMRDNSNTPDSRALKNKRNLSINCCIFVRHLTISKDNHYNKRINIYKWRDLSIIASQITSIFTVCLIVD